MKNVFDGDNFRKSLMQYRLITKEVDLRTASSEMGISAATLSRVESGNSFDIKTGLSISDWMEVPFSSFFLTTDDSTKTKIKKSKKKINLKN